MAKVRRGFDEEFKREALRLAESGDASIAQVARDLGINVETLRNWRRKAREEREGWCSQNTAVSRGGKSLGNG